MFPRALIKLLMRSSRERHLKLQQKQAVEAGKLVRGRRRRCGGGSEMDDDWMKCGGLNFFDAGLRLRSPVRLCARAVTAIDNDWDQYSPIIRKGQIVPLCI